MLKYQIPPGVQAITSGSIPLLTTAAGGRVIVDARILALWKKADGQSLESLAGGEDATGAAPLEMRSALACLAEAGLLSRQPESQPEVQPPSNIDGSVSVVIVGYNSREWLAECFASLFGQTLTPLEVILVDNGSSDHTEDWANENYPQVSVLRTDGSLASAINYGVEHAQGDYFLILNPDVKLAPDALAQLVSTARQYPDSAAVAAKLRLLWTPGFINGLGNFVGAYSWGTDIALGHLDLGQFDSWREVPSACFAAALIPAAAWENVGPLDIGFPMYYEDSEWCYRARLLGYTIRAAPQALVYHAFSARLPGSEQSQLSPQKLFRIVYGRFRFAGKLLDTRYRTSFLFRYVLEDVVNLIVAPFRWQWYKLLAYAKAYRMVFEHNPEIRQASRVIQQRRRITDDQLFHLQRNVPLSWMRNGMPLLTWDIVVHEYLPLMVGQNTRKLPEFPEEQYETVSNQGLQPSGFSLGRARSIWRTEGAAALMHRIGKRLQWRLMRP